MILENYQAAELAFGALIVIASWLFIGKPNEGKAGAGKERDIGIDFIKGISIAAIVILHANNIAQWNLPINDFLGCFLPIFVIVSGFLLFSRYKPEVDASSFLRKAFFRLVLPYALFTLIVHFFYYGMSFRPYDLALDLIFGRMNGYNLYFIPLLIQLYLLFPLLSRFRRALFSPAGQLILLAISFLFFMQDLAARQPLWNSDLVSLAFCGRYLFYFVFGGYMCMHQKAWQSGRELLALAALFASFAFAFSMFQQRIYFGFFLPIALFFLLRWCFLAAGAANAAVKAAASFGRHSLAVYIMHTIVIYNFLVFLPLAWNGAGGAFTFFALALSLTYLAALAFDALYKAFLSRLFPQASA